MKISEFNLLQLFAQLLEFDKSGFEANERCDFHFPNQNSYSKADGYVEAIGIDKRELGIYSQYLPDDLDLEALGEDHDQIFEVRYIKRIGGQNHLGFASLIGLNEGVINGAKEFITAWDDDRTYRTENRLLEEYGETISALHTEVQESNISRRGA